MEYKFDLYSFVYIIYLYIILKHYSQNSVL